MLHYNCQFQTFGLLNQSQDSDEIEAGRGLLSDWSHMAARDGILTTYNVAELMAAIDSSASKSPTLKRHRDMKAAKEARDIMKKAFPRLELVRHGAAHSILFSSTSQEVDHASGDSNAFINLNGGGTIYVGDSLFGSTYTCTVNKKLVSYDLTPNSFAAIRKVNWLYWKSFDPIEAELRARHAKKFSGD